MDSVFVTIRLDKSQTTFEFWKGVFEDFITPEQTHETSTEIVLYLGVKQYDLSDHQFLRLKLEIEKVETTILIPRQLVMLIAQGPRGIKPFGFDTEESRLKPTAKD